MLASVVNREFVMRDDRRLPFGKFISGAIHAIARPSDSQVGQSWQLKDWIWRAILFRE
jgi:hypothetical protein